MMAGSGEGQVSVQSSQMEGCLASSLSQNMSLILKSNINLKLRLDVILKCRMNV